MSALRNVNALPRHSNQTCKNCIICQKLQEIIAKKSNFCKFERLLCVKALKIYNNSPILSGHSYTTQGARAKITQFTV